MSRRLERETLDALLAANLAEDKDSEGGPVATSAQAADPSADEQNPEA